MAALIASGFRLGPSPGSQTERCRCEVEIKISTRDIARKLLGRRVIDRLKYSRDQARSSTIRLVNGIFGYTKIDIGAGADADDFSWWTGDIQTGFVFDERTVLPFKPSSIDFAFSSMFFEHINDTTAAAIFAEVHRVLKPGRCFRVAVPDFSIYIQKYRAGDRGFFFSDENPNFKTWAAMGVPLDMEHLLIGAICSLHNLEHEMVRYPSFEDFAAAPPRVFHPFQERLAGYYCGPAIGLTTEQIRGNLSAMSEAEFVEWVFAETNRRAEKYATFNSFHKNQWSLEKMDRFARAAGFSSVEASKFHEAPHSPGSRREKPQHAILGQYFNILKA